jgi:hypothetical protein
MSVTPDAFAAVRQTVAEAEAAFLATRSPDHDMDDVLVHTLAEAPAQRP